MHILFNLMVPSFKADKDEQARNSDRVIGPCKILIVGSRKVIFLDSDHLATLCEQLQSNFCGLLIFNPPSYLIKTELV